MHTAPTLDGGGQNRALIKLVAALKTENRRLVKAAMSRKKKAEAE
jgi:hypothetical protein